MKEILLAHLKQYPQMQLQDVVKLLYQSEFGDGHMITSPEKSLDRLKEEYKSFKWEYSPIICEPIGGEMYRIYLSALEDGLSEETLNRMFTETAARASGTREGFEEKLRCLLQCCRSGELPFTLAQAEAFLDTYRSQGYPAVRHSSCYRSAYHPAYRIVSASYARYYEAFVRIDRALRERMQVQIAIDGMCAAGKSTMGRILQSIYSCRLFHMDDFFLQPYQRTADRLSQIGGNVDYERFKKEILDHLNDREGLEYQIYSCKAQRLDCRIQTDWTPLSIIEGSYSQHPFFGDIWDLRFFCEIDPAEQLNRIRIRNGEAMCERFKQEWIPKENAYFDTFGIREKSICLTDGKTKNSKNILTD